MKEMYRLLLSNPNMSNEEKVAISHKLLNAIVAEELFIDAGYYLRVTDTEDADLMDVQLWSRSVDSDGVMTKANTGCNKEQILEALHKVYLREKEENVVKKL